MFEEPNAKKVEHKLTPKISYGRSSRHTWLCFINYYYFTVKVKKNNGTCTPVLMSNYVSEVAYEA